MEPNKLINFLNHGLGPKVSYNCVADDLYKPENLISSSRECLNLGFMAYNVVKPPIDLVFSFSHKIDIHIIKLWLKFNTNVKTTGIELYTMFNNQYVRVGVFNSYLENGNQSESGECLFYRSDLYPKHINALDNIKQQKFEKTYSLRSTNQIKLVLKYTNRCCVPVLKKIEVWGLPSRECSNEERLKINKLWNNATSSPITMYSSDDATATNENDDTDVKQDQSSINSNIPEEFLDSITYEIMTLPMVLPSGKSVDQVTIERHTATEMANGRCSSDPFTGLPFTFKRKPIYNHVLKLQIDEFLIKHQNEDEVKLLPRAIGRKRARPNNDNLSNWRSNQISINSLKPSSTLSTVNLDVLVSNAVENIKKFRASEDEISVKQCIDCDVEYRNGVVLYKITNCGHLICRSCLMNSKKPIKVCTLCSKEYQNSDLIKLNL